MPFQLNGLAHTLYLNPYFSMFIQVKHFHIRVQAWVLVSLIIAWFLNPVSSLMKTLDTGASKSFMSKSHYLHCKSLHSLSKFASKIQRIQVGNGQYVSILFVILIAVNISSHMFEIYTLVSKIHENVDLVLSIKYIFELEGAISLQECCFSFLNRSVPIFPKERIILKPKEQKLVKIDAPFSDEISGLAIIKLLDKLTQSIIMLKVKLTRNAAILDMKTM